MLKITFMGAGSTVFARNVIGDCMCSETLREAEFALYDIDGQRLQERAEILGREPPGSPEGRHLRGECHPGGSV